MGRAFISMVAVTLIGQPALAFVMMPEATQSYTTPLAIETKSGLSSKYYNPWAAAALTYIPMTPAAFAAGYTTGNFTYQQSATLALTNPTPGLGQFYVGEPVRGALFLGAGIGLLLGTLAANVSLYQGHRFTSSPQDTVRDGVNIAYVLGSTALSLWAAWDAYRIAEEKNRTATNLGR